MAKPLFDIDPGGALKASLRAGIAKGVDDLRLPLNLIAQQWFKSNRAIFTLKGPGQYADYKPSKNKDGSESRPSVYEKFKIRHLGSQYPMLSLTGALAASITDPTDQNAVNYITDKVAISLGTQVKSPKGRLYANDLHYGTKFMAARPVVLFGNEQVAPGALKGRVEIWKKLIQDHIMKYTKAPNA